MIEPTNPKRSKNRPPVPPPPKSGPLQYCFTFLKVVLLFSLVPLIVAIPFGFKYVADFLNDKLDYFYYLGGVYAVVWLILSYQKFHLHTWESFFTLFLKYLLFSMGSFAMLGAFNSMEPATKQASLVIWMSIGTALYLVYMYYDNTDYKELQKLEEEREKKENEEWEKAIQKPSKKKSTTANTSKSNENKKEKQVKKD